MERSELISRTGTYAKHKCSTVWVYPKPPPKPGEIKRPPPWLFDVHQWGPKVVFHYSGGAMVTPVHYATYWRWVEAFDVYGGYEVRAKRMKEAVLASGPIAIADLLHDHGRRGGFAMLPKSFAHPETWPHAETKT